MTTQPPAAGADARALEAFTDYFVRNYPGPDTIIHDPHWHAPRIFRAAQAAFAQRDAESTGIHVDLTKTIDTGHADTEGEAAELFEHLNCPTCGGSGHVDDATPSTHVSEHLAVATFVRCGSCGGEFDKSEWDAASECPECEEPKQEAGQRREHLAVANAEPGEAGEGADVFRPCPFCGTAEHLSLQSVGSMTADMPGRPYRVICTHIDHDTVAGPIGYGELEARRAWNNRPATPGTTSAREEELRAIAREVLYEAERAFTGPGRLYRTEAAQNAIVGAMLALAGRTASQVPGRGGSSAQAIDAQR